jgi:hypothetical protein
MPKPPVPGHDAADGETSARRGIQPAASPDPDSALEEAEVSRSAGVPAPDTAHAQEPPATETSADPPAELGQADAQRWQALRRRLPHIIRRGGITRREATAWAQESERFFAGRDPADNASTRLPAGEQARIPVIWLAEVFTPITLPSLITGMSDLTSRQRGLGPRADDDPAEWIASARRRGGRAWRSLPPVRPRRSQFPVDEIVDPVPAGIAYIQLSLHALTSTVTVLTAQFGLEDNRAQGLEYILNREFATRAEMLPNSGYTILRVEQQKAAAVEEWRASLRQEAAGWIAERFPGSFHRLAPGQLPTIEFLLTGQYRPWEPHKGAGTPGWAGMLDLSGSHGYWQCASIPSLRLGERRDSGLRPSQRHRLVLAGLKREFVTEPVGAPGSIHILPEAIYQLGLTVTEPLVRWSLTALIRELEEQLAGLQDVADQASRRRTPRALADTQRQLLQTGIDSRIVVNDIVRYAQDPWWKHGVLDFTEVVAPGQEGQLKPTPSLVESLRQGQITDGRRVVQLETDLREILSTSAELASAGENLRLQRRVVWLTVISLIVAIVAAWAAVMALRNSGGHPTTPTHATNSSVHARSSPAPDNAGLIVPLYPFLSSSELLKAKLNGH